MRIKSLFISVALGLGMTLALVAILKRSSIVAAPAGTIHSVGGALTAGGHEIAENAPPGGLPLLRLLLGNLSEERLSETN